MPPTHLLNRLGVSASDATSAAGELTDLYGSSGWGVREFVRELEHFGFYLDADIRSSELAQVVSWARNEVGADEGDELGALYDD